jgi:K+-transporting ATPase KdpF subunit
MQLEFLLAAVAAVAILLYLLYAMLRPERF